MRAKVSDGEVASDNAEEITMDKQGSMPWRLAIAGALLLTAAIAPATSQAPGGATLFEGARLITGDGSAPIENSAFIVVNNQFTQVGRRGELPVPAGAARVRPS